MKDCPDRRQYRQCKTCGYIHGNKIGCNPQGLQKEATNVRPTASPSQGKNTPRMAVKDTKEEILKAFKLFDDDETGKISFQNLKRVAKELGENLTDEELQVWLCCTTN